VLEDRRSPKKARALAEVITVFASWKMGSDVYSAESKRGVDSFCKRSC
jgi:hypothetical protein